VLVEKPITDTAAQARELIALAARVKRILQVGHLERFNAAILAAEPYLRSPRFVECHRLAPYRERGTDVNVVLDLMIHDIDIVQTIVGAPITSIDAVGTPVFSRKSTLPTRASASPMAVSPMPPPRGSASRPSEKCAYSRTTPICHLICSRRS